MNAVLKAAMVLYRYRIIDQKSPKAGILDIASQSRPQVRQWAGCISLQPGKAAGFLPICSRRLDYASFMHKEAAPVAVITAASIVDTTLVDDDVAEHGGRLTSGEENSILDRTNQISLDVISRALKRTRIGYSQMPIRLCLSDKTDLLC